MLLSESNQLWKDRASPLPMPRLLAGFIVYLLPSFAHHILTPCTVLPSQHLTLSISNCLCLDPGKEVEL